MTNSKNRLLLVHGHAGPMIDCRRMIAQRYRFDECDLARLDAASLSAERVLVIDAPLESEADTARIRAALADLPDDGPGIMFVIDGLARPLVVRAHALGGEAIVPRPLREAALFSALDTLLARSRRKLWSADFGAEAPGLTAGTNVLEDLFQFALSGTRLTQYELYDRGDAVIGTLAETGLGRWVEAVKAHHSQTFRHSLLVTGIAVGFGQQLGMRQDDLRRLALGGLIHDIGKASIPVAVLEKPVALTAEETLIVREHPRLGQEMLRRQGGFAPEMIDVVAHHHEMLDGSGYPDHLAGSQIKDLVRVVTIADIFAALIERRAYKLPVPNEEAYAMLSTMDGKLDPFLVAAFKPIALETRLAA